MQYNILWSYISFVVSLGRRYIYNNLIMSLYIWFFIYIYRPMFLSMTRYRKLEELYLSHQIGKFKLTNANYFLMYHWVIVCLRLHFSFVTCPVYLSLWYPLNHEFMIHFITFFRSCSSISLMQLWLVCLRMFVKFSFFKFNSLIS